MINGRYDKRNDKPHPSGGEEVRRKMKVKIYRFIKSLPKVFITVDLNKWALTEDYVNCDKYISIAGLSQSGCLELKGNKFHEVRGIYYTPNSPAISLTFRNNIIRYADDVKNLVKQFDLKEATINPSRLLIKWDNYTIKVYDKYKKGKMYDFPQVVKQGHLTVFRIPEPSTAYMTVYDDNNNPTRTINRDMVKETTELQIYNHTVKFSNPVLMLKDVFNTPGGGFIVYIPNNNTYIEITSPDHGKENAIIEKDSWILFSHTAPLQED